MSSSGSCCTWRQHDCNLTWRSRGERYFYFQWLYGLTHTTNKSQLNNYRPAALTPDIIKNLSSDAALHPGHQDSLPSQVNQELVSQWHSGNPYISTLMSLPGFDHKIYSWTHIVRRGRLKNTFKFIIRTSTRKVQNSTHESNKRLICFDNKENL